MMTTTITKDSGAVYENVLPFDAARIRRAESPSSPGIDDARVAAVVTVTRFIGEERVHAQIPVFAREVHSDSATRAQLRDAMPDLSQLLAAGAVEANAYLDRLVATRSARPITEFYPRR
jgi:hypothetical protein